MISERAGNDKINTVLEKEQLGLFLFKTPQIQ